MLKRIDNSLVINTSKIISIAIEYEIRQWCDDYKPLDIESIKIVMNDGSIHYFYHNHAIRVLHLLGLKECGDNLED